MVARNTELHQAFLKIETRRQSMGKKITDNAFATRRLIEAVYSYLSSTSITTDSVDFWIEKILQANNGRN